jgi:hypothetical protein
MELGKDGVKRYSFIRKFGTTGFALRSVQSFPVLCLSLSIGALGASLKELSWFLPNL